MGRNYDPIDFEDFSFNVAWMLRGGISIFNHWWGWTVEAFLQELIACTIEDYQKHSDPFVVLYLCY